MDWQIVIPVYEAELRRIATMCHRGCTALDKKYPLPSIGFNFGHNSTFIQRSLRVVQSIFQRETFGNNFGLSDKPSFVLPSEFLFLCFISDEYYDAIWKTTLFVLRKIDGSVEFDRKLENFFTETVERCVISTCEQLNIAETEEDPNFEENLAIGDLPAQDSTQNILDILNDDCISAILCKLESVGDFANASEVCMRFREVCMTAFPFKTLRIGRYEKSRFKSIYPPVSMSWYMDSIEEKLLNELHHFLSIFGQRVNSIEWVLHGNFQTYFVQKTIRTTAEFCGQSLTNLKVLGNYEIDTLSQFEMLERLEYYHGFLHSFGSPQKLKYLKLSCLWTYSDSWSYEIIPSWTCIKQSFSNLEEAHFEYFNFILEDDPFIEFQRLNPQLKRLTAIHCTSTPTMAFKNISSRLPNLESLHFEGGDVAIQDLNGLKKLKRLCIPTSTFKLPELNSLIALDLPIEELEITPSNAYLLSKISKLNSIKKLSLNISNIPKNELNIKNLLALNLIISGQVSLNSLKTIIGNIKNVYMLTLRLEWTIIDSDAYNSVIALVRNRMRVTMIVDRWSGRIDVDKEVLKANRAWLDIQTE